MPSNEIRLEAQGLMVPPRQLFRVPHRPNGPAPGVRIEGGEVIFIAAGWYEVLLAVEWSPENRDGHRFSHTAIPDSHPLHSEAIEADVLADLSDGRQLLRGNTIFDPESPISSLALEVWHNASESLAVKEASIALRRLDPAA